MPDGCASARCSGSAGQWRLHFEIYQNSSFSGRGMGPVYHSLKQHARTIFQNCKISGYLPYYAMFSQIDEETEIASITACGAAPVMSRKPRRITMNFFEGLFRRIIQSRQTSPCTRPGSRRRCARPRSCTARRAPKAAWARRSRGRASASCTGRARGRRR